MAWFRIRSNFGIWRLAHLLISRRRGEENVLHIILVGDPTDHGGKVITGSPNHDVDGKAVARFGDKVECPQCYPGGKPHGVNKIITAHSTVTVDGIPLAVDGSATECGCKLIGNGPAPM